MAQATHHVTCAELHVLIRSLPRYRFPFEKSALPKNGVYFLFEKGESGHNGERIVRVGSHTGVNQLPSRLLQHFVNENKDRSIFRKQIGRCLLVNGAYASTWEIDFTTAKAREEHGAKKNTEKEKAIEHQITKRLQENFSFGVISIDDMPSRLRLESACIATVAQCTACAASASWLGKQSPKDIIKHGKLWQVNDVDASPLTKNEFEQLRAAALARD